MPNGLAAYSSKMSGAELKEIIKNFVEGYEEDLFRLTVALCQWLVVFLWKLMKRKMAIH